MKTWFSADLHLGHKRIIELCNRPFSSVDEMNDAIVENFNSMVGDNDRLVILGDICLGKLDESLEVLGKLKGAEVVLIPGNHDRWSSAYEHRGDAAEKRYAFQQKYQDALGDRGVVLRDLTPSYWEGLFSLTGDFKHISGPLSGVRFSHYPYVGDSHGDGDERYGWLRPPAEGGPLIHGHVHGEWRIRDDMFNVGVDVNEFLPVSDDELSEWVTSLG